MKILIYIKKTAKEIDSDEENYITASRFECSKREIDFFTKTLEELNNTNN